MSEHKDIRYIKDIIKEYNALLDTWGPSDLWDLEQFKTLESLIFEKTKIDINANTLKRFFQQKTDNPQLATKNALCRFLGYSGYTDFVMKKTMKEEVSDKPDDKIPYGIEDNKDTANNKRDEKRADKTNPREANHNIKRSRLYIVLIIVLLAIIGGSLLYMFKSNDINVERQISKIHFSASRHKGICPLTITFSYDIPPKLLNDVTIVFEEATGDLTEKKLKQGPNQINATYIYEGDALCYLKYKDKVIKTIDIESRKAGWSVFVRDERRKIFSTFPIESALNEKGYASLPIDVVPQEARTNHLFVSYVFYQDKLVDGESFIYEARVRNSPQEHATPCSDIIMYISSDSATHGFAMNENGYAYLKFISGENTIMGDEHNLSRFNFNSSEWHIMTIRVEDKKTKFYIDGDEVLGMDFHDAAGYINEFILRFKGCGAVDYVKIYRLDGEVVFEENFDHILAFS